MKRIILSTALAPVLLLATLWGAVVQAQEEKAPPAILKEREVVNLSASITGNQEQPTVLYVVPWKQAEDTTILYLPLDSKAMEELFSHVERVEHTRQVQFLEQLN